ncbi:MAG: single-stranded DNA-binding protein [Verrucomicrobiales bacterium]|nr:single-stranded DNA-binding protein [Verrucomicrobiales bacterium]
MMSEPKEILQEMLNRLGFEATIEENETEKGTVLNIETDDPGRLIGRRGRTLSDLQYLTNRINFQNNKEAPKVSVDVGNYRNETSSDMASKALEAAEKARRWGDIVELPPMNAYDRRVVHQTLKEAGDISTESIEVDGTNHKAIIIRPTG